MANLGAIGRPVMEFKRHLCSGHYRNNSGFTANSIGNIITLYSISLPGHYVNNGTTSSNAYQGKIRQLDFLYSSYYPQWYSSSPTTYTYSGTITENLPATSFKISFIDTNGSVQGTTTIDTSSTTSYSISGQTSQYGYLLAQATEGSVWQSGTAYTTGTYIFPTLPSSYPYFFKCTSAGTSGSVEPTWTTVSGTTVTDGTVTWTNMGRMVQPIAHGIVVGV